MMSLARVALTVLVLLVPFATCADEAPKPFTQDDARAIVGNLQKVVSPRGIDERLLILVGGVHQWITVKGRDDRNPILLFIHGGPAAPEMPTSWTFQDGWEDFFTVVQWDQRGSGKSYNANDPADIKFTLSVQQITDDAAEVVQYLRQRYHQDKVFVIAHSWGTVPGLRLAQEHPEWLYAYIGMGQIIDMRENERLDYESVLASAKADHNDKAVKELEAIAPYPDPKRPVTFDEIGVERGWSVYYGGLTWNRKSYDYYYDAGKLSPDYTDQDLAAIDKGSLMSLTRLLPELMAVDFTRTTDFKCPIVIFNGRHDITTSAALAAAWFKTVRAPVKKLVWFEDSAHMMQIEQPGQVLLHLVQDVRPLSDRDSYDTSTER
ncbi:MAG TPA: alpha/beta hydrolase [Gammaproteobacteria bacterium]